MSHRCNNELIINLNEVQKNLTTIRQHVDPTTRIMLMVKANAYGTNLCKMAQFFIENGIDILGVAHVEEAICLRNYGVSCDIFVLNASSYEIEAIIEHNLQVAISSVDQVEQLQHAAIMKGVRSKAHLHIDTGMKRFGCSPKMSLFLAKQIASASHLDFEGVMTHFSSADNPAHDAFTMQQRDTFQNSLDEIRNAGIFFRTTHACNSSALCRFAFNEFRQVSSMVRIGLSAYGLYAFSPCSAFLKLSNALTLRSTIVGINHCLKNEPVGYGQRHIVTNNQATIAVVPLGYHDGIHHSFSGGGYVLVHGRQAPIVGNICMDYMHVDVSTIENAKVGDSVLVFGSDSFGNTLSAETFSSFAGTISHELITCLGPRIRRTFLEENKC